MAETSQSDPGNMHSGFSSLVQSLLPKDTLLRTYFTVMLIPRVGEKTVDSDQLATS